MEVLTTRSGESNTNMSEQTIKIDYDIASCFSIESEIDCENLSGCEWKNMGGMSHCMNSGNDCIDLSENECRSDSNCEWMNMGSTSSHCMEKGSMMDMGSHTPHFIAIDEVNRYWFVTTINSGYVGRYNLDTDELVLSNTSLYLSPLKTVCNFQLAYLKQFHLYFSL